MNNVLKSIPNFAFRQKGFSFFSIFALVVYERFAVYSPS